MTQLMALFKQVTTMSLLVNPSICVDLLGSELFLPHKYNLNGIPTGPVAHDVRH